MTTGERIKLRRKEIGLSAEQVAEKIGVSPSTIYRYENGDIENVNSDILEPLAFVLRTTPAVLMGWQQPSSAQFSNAFDEYPNVYHLPFTKKVPLVGNIACGEPILADENIGGYIDAPEDVEADFCLRCRGDSMIGARILDGDIVFIRSQNDVDDGEIAAVLIDNEATLKRVYKLGDRLELRAENPHFPRMVYQGLELADVRIIGKAVAFLSEVR